MQPNPSIKAIIMGQFEVSILQESDIEEAAQCFAKGYIEQQPIFVALKLQESEHAELKEELRIQLKNGVKQRPLQQLVARDTQKNGSIVGVYCTVHLIDLEQQDEDQCVFLSKKQHLKSEKLKFKFEIARKLYPQEYVDSLKKEVQETKNPVLFQQVQISILPEYQTQGIFQKFTAMQFFISSKLGVRYFIDTIFNIKMVQFPMKNFGSKIIQETDLSEIQFQGETPFKDAKFLCAKLLETGFESEIAKKMIAEGEKEFEEFYNQFPCYQQLKK